MSDSGSLYDIRALDPPGQLASRDGLTSDDVDQISELMAAMGRLRNVERQLSEAARRYMRLNETDMRALLYLIVSGNRGLIVTPGMLARHLGITTASTAKMLKRLESGGHISRAGHPTDRRALAIQISPETALAAQETIGRQQAHRFEPAARLDHDQRQIVINFLNATTAALDGALHEPIAIEPGPGADIST